ncbi:AbrB/MazE/SpoVT family DNA-binding domain-containing protein [Desulfococcaceae bacterium HSG8]|nr:AbrB/MazE/SpoVT family DNA-binding domain-containing protein [Desulfococcaceae bacterium HSG8]
MAEILQEPLTAETPDISGVITKNGVSALATLTTGGQVTIPENIRESLRIHIGDTIEILITDKREAVIRPVSKKVDDVFCKLLRHGRKAVSPEDMDEAVRSRMRDMYK